jgi:hypothetical protein
MPTIPLFPADPEVERAWLYDTLDEIIKFSEAHGIDVPNRGGIKTAVSRYAAGLPMNTRDV